MSGRPLRQILLVEDDEDTRQRLTLALGAQGYGVVQAGDAERGLEALRGGDRFDMVLSDYDLPGKTGAAMLREAQRGGLLGSAATLIVTAHPIRRGWTRPPSSASRSTWRNSFSRSGASSIPSLRTRAARPPVPMRRPRRTGPAPLKAGPTGYDAGPTR